MDAKAAAASMVDAVSGVEAARPKPSAAGDRGRNLGCYTLTANTTQMDAMPEIGIASKAGNEELMMSGTVLIVEDDTRIANWVKVYFERAGFCAEITHDGQSGLALARNLAPDLIILDLMLPRLNGVELCRILRRESDVPIIMLTAREAHADRIIGLDSGADDYIVKPFDPAEVIARAYAVLRRVKGRVQQVLTRGDITLNETTRSVTVNGELVALSQAQIALLSTFMRHPNQVLTRDRLISLTFNDEFDGFDRAIDSQIARLRRQIARDGRQPIQTVYGAGYRFVAEDE